MMFARQDAKLRLPSGTLMKQAALFLLPAGLLLVVSALVMLTPGMVRLLFIFAGIAVQVLGLVLLAQSHFAAKGDD
jgi:Flp pilus assembly protein TadB